MPSYTFVSTANAFVMRGATPVFVDVNYDDANINFEEIEKSISKKTKAVVVVHYAGIACEIEKIKKLCNQKKIFLIEDAAHSILSKKNQIGLKRCKNDKIYLNNFKSHLNIHILTNSLYSEQLD